MPAVRGATDACEGQPCRHQGRFLGERGTIVSGVAHDYLPIGDRRSQRILAIDPGPQRSAYVVLDRGVVDSDYCGIDANEDLAWRIGLDTFVACDVAAIEMIASYGMAVGREVFETCVWIGRFQAELDSGYIPSEYVYRRDVKLHLCGSARAKDANVRQALLDRYGGKALAVGTKKAPGPLYGFKADMWAALGVAITYAEAKG